VSCSSVQSVEKINGSAWGFIGIDTSKERKEGYISPHGHIWSIFGAGAITGISMHGWDCILSVGMYNYSLERHCIGVVYIVLLPYFFEEHMYTCACRSRMGMK
jgi:hypothetical protein